MYISFSLHFIKLLRSSVLHNMCLVKIIRQSVFYPIGVPHSSGFWFLTPPRHSCPLWKNVGEKFYVIAVRVTVEHFLMPFFCKKWFSTICLNPIFNTTQSQTIKLCVCASTYVHFGMCIYAYIYNIYIPKFIYVHTHTHIHFETGWHFATSDY